MKKQTTTLLVSLAIVLLLTGLLIFLMARFQGEGGYKEQKDAEGQEQGIPLLSMSVQQINTIHIKNPSDDFFLVNQGEHFVVEGLEEVEASKLNINNLTAILADLTADRELLDLSAKQTLGDSAQQLSQYGLDNPSYIVSVTSTEGKQEVLQFGKRAPDNKSVYLLYANKVYLMDDSILDSISKERYSFLDNKITPTEPNYEEAVIILSGAVRPSPITIEIKMLEKQDEQDTEEKVDSKIKRQYTMTTPQVQTITKESALKVTEGLFDIYANAVEAVSPTPEEMTAFGLDEPYSIVSLQVDGTDLFTLKASEPNENNYVYLMKDGSPQVYFVSASRLSWLTIQAEQLIQSVYVPSQAKDLSELRVTSQNESYDFVVSGQNGELKVNCNGQEVDGKLFESLYQTITAIPPQSMSSQESNLETVLTMNISYLDKEREDDLFELIPTGDGSVLISFNGESRYTASQNIVYQILENCERVLQGKSVSVLA